MKGDDYPDPDFVVAQIRAFCPNTLAIDATEIAKEAGNPRAMNTVLLGVVAGTGILPFDAEILRAVIMANVPKKTIEANEARQKARRRVSVLRVRRDPTGPARPRGVTMSCSTWRNSP